MTQPIKHLFRKNIVAHFAHAAVEISPYPCPDDLPEVLTDLHNALAERWPGEPFAEMPHDDVDAFLKEFTHTHPKVRLWNERKNGNPTPYGFVTAYTGKPAPDDDFIDLDALWGNASRSLRQEEERRQDRYTAEEESQSEADVEVVYNGYNNAIEMAVSITIVGTPLEVRNAEKAYFGPQHSPTPTSTTDASN